MYIYIEKSCFLSCSSFQNINPRKITLFLPDTTQQALRYLDLLSQRQEMTQMLNYPKTPDGPKCLRTQN